jgi:hypothetical protein
MVIMPNGFIGTACPVGRAGAPRIRMCLAAASPRAAEAPVRLDIADEALRAAVGNGGHRAPGFRVGVAPPQAFGRARWTSAEQVALNADLGCVW